MSVLQDPAILARLQPREYYKKWMETYFPIRPDQRKDLEFRPITIQSGILGTAEASATVRLGETTVIGAVKLEVAEPAVDFPNEGFLVLNVTLCAGCSPLVRAGPPLEYAQNLTRRMTLLLQTLNVITNESLIITPGKLSWVVYLDAFVINDSGNIFDAIWLALLAALRDVKLPSIRLDKETGMIYSNPNEAKPLPVNIFPLPLSFAYLPDQNSLLCDPTNEEENVLEDRMANLLVDPESHAILSCDARLIPSVEVIKTTLSNESVHKHLQTIRKLLL